MIQAALRQTQYNLSQRLSEAQIELLLENALILGAMDAAASRQLTPDQPGAYYDDQDTARMLECLGSAAADLRANPKDSFAGCRRELMQRLQHRQIHTVTALLAAYHFGRNYAPEAGLPYSLEQIRLQPV